MSSENLFDRALNAEGIDDPRAAAFLRSIYTQESGGGRNTKTSNRGAVGGMQIIPSTFKSVADTGWDIGNSEHNLRAGIRYAMQMWGKAKGDPVLAGAGYYGGPGGLEKARKGIPVSDPVNPKAPNTLQYGQSIASNMARFGRSATAPAAPSAVDSLPMAQEPVVAAAPEVQEAPFDPSMGEPTYTPVAPMGAGPAWTAFLEAMPKSRAPEFTPAAFKFDGGAAKFSPPPVISSQKPRIEAFKSWKAKLA